MIFILHIAVGYNISMYLNKTKNHFYLKCRKKNILTLTFNHDQNLNYYPNYIVMRILNNRPKKKI